MRHRIDDSIVVGFHDGEHLEFYSHGTYMEEMFERVFNDLDDSKGISLKGRTKFKASYLDIIEKCNIENSMDLIYKLLNKHISSEENIYFKDDNRSFPADDVLKVLEFLNHLHGKKVPKRFIGGFLLLMVKLVYFPLPKA